MASLGTLHFTALLNADRVLDVVHAMSMMHRLLEASGHVWTEEEAGLLEKANDAFRREHLTVEPS